MALWYSQLLIRKINIYNSYKTITVKLNVCTCRQQIFKNYSVWGTTIPEGEGSGEAVQKKKKTVTIPKITLLHGDEITVTTFEDAQRLSKRRDLKLVKIVDIDTKTQRPIYKLMTGSEYHAEDIKQREQKKKSKESFTKGEKLMLINCKIETHDLEVNIKKISKWIAKFYEVRVIINGDNNRMQKAVSK